MGLRDELEQHEATVKGLLKLLEDAEEAIKACEDGMIRDRLLRIVRRRFGILHKEGTGSLFSGQE